MGKICDPPPFNGGQIDGRMYFLYLKYLISGRFIGELIFNRPGKIKGIAVVSRPNIIVNDGVSSYAGAGNSGNDIILTFNSGKNQDRIVFDDRSLQILEFKVLSPYPDAGGDPPGSNCKCSDDSCRVDCAGQPDGFCCIDHSVTDRLLQVLQN